MKEWGRERATSNGGQALPCKLQIALPKSIENLARKAGKLGRACLSTEDIFPHATSRRRVSWLHFPSPADTRMKDARGGNGSEMEKIISTQRKQKLARASACARESLRPISEKISSDMPKAILSAKQRPHVCKTNDNALWSSNCCYATDSGALRTLRYTKLH